MILRTLLGAGFLLVAGLSTLDCGAHAGGGGGGGGGGGDGGLPGFDVGNPGFDVGNPGFDVGNPGFDGGLPGFDLGIPTFDLGNPTFDLGNPFADTGSVGADCASLCARVSSAGCPSSVVSNCNTTCSQLGSIAPARCTSTISLFLQCAQTSTISCTGTNPFTSCTGVENEVVSCITGGTDAGTRVDTGVTSDPCVGLSTCATCTAASACGWCNGRCYVGTSTGPTGATCATPWAWTSAQCTM